MPLLLNIMKFGSVVFFNPSTYFVLWKVAMLALPITT
jgi:hypothetical protein